MKRYDHERQLKPIEPARWPEQTLPAWVHPVSRTYLQARGINQLECETYDLHYTDFGEWRNRLLIPMYDDAGELVCFQGRILDPAYKGRMKYRTAGPRPLYKPWDDPHGSVIVVVEGPFDLYSIQRVASAVATLGVNPNGQQVADLILLARSHPWLRVAVWFDSDAFAESYNIVRLIQPHLDIPVEVVTDFDSKDPGEMSRERVEAVLQL